MEGNSEKHHFNAEQSREREAKIGQVTIRLMACQCLRIRASLKRRTKSKRGSSPFLFFINLFS